MMKTQWILICSLIFALLTAIFAVSNVETVQVNFLVAQTSMPLILVILTSTLLGGLIVGFFGIFRQYRLQRKIRHLERQLQEVSGSSLPSVGQAQAAAASAGAAQPENDQPPHNEA